MADYEIARIVYAFRDRLEDHLMHDLLPYLKEKDKKEAEQGGEPPIPEDHIVQVCGMAEDEIRDYLKGWCEKLIARLELEIEDAGQSW
jgi:hypothetical protein